MSDGPRGAGGARAPECIFCRIATGQARSWKVGESERAYAFLDIHPATRYHTLVIPRAHYRDVYELPEDELSEVMALVKRVAKLYREQLGIENVQIINSSGAEAQQDVFHVHFHLVPRSRGDGQDIVWWTHPEWTADYDQMIERLSRG
jgi:histidine triad (HIT) family protein